MKGVAVHMKSYDIARVRVVCVWCACGVRVVCVWCACGVCMHICVCVHMHVCMYIMYLELI